MSDGPQSDGMTHPNETIFHVVSRKDGTNLLVEIGFGGLK